MDLIDKLTDLAQKIERQRDHIETEEATKNAFVLPFIHALGYDVFDPLEVIPEFTADVGIKKGEKVDYAIRKDERIVMLFECKCCDGKLEARQASQLFRYFTSTEAHFGVLTDGIRYQFFTDLDEPNRMDERPFLEFNILELNEGVVGEIKRLTKGQFDLEKARVAAEELKYTKGIRRVIEEELSEPSDEFVRLLASRVYSGRITQGVRDDFTDIIRRAFSQMIADRISDRLKVALRNEEESEALSGEVEQPDGESDDADGERVETTDEEMEGFFLIKSILRDLVETERISARDTISYFGILLDDNNRKPICRLHFNRAQKYLGLFDEEKNENRVPIDHLDDIYDHFDAIRAPLAFYDESIRERLAERDDRGSSEPVETPTNEVAHEAP